MLIQASSTICNQILFRALFCYAYNLSMCFYNACTCESSSEYRSTSWCRICTCIIDQCECTKTVNFIVTKRVKKINNNCFDIERIAYDL